MLTEPSTASTWPGTATPTAASACPELALRVLDESGDLGDERWPIRRRDVLVEDAVAIVGDDDRRLGAADVDAGDQQTVRVAGCGRHRTSPRPSCCSMSNADAPSATTSSWTWPKSICVSRASIARALDLA